MRQTALILFLILLASHEMTAQQKVVPVLNEVIASLIGEQDVEEIPVFETIKQVCNSGYVSCNSRKQIVGLNFQYTNLNGRIPESISQLTSLVWVNLEYNYLSGTIPEGFSKMKNLEELIINGNFLSGPLPSDLDDISNKTLIDFSKNAIKTTNKKLIKRCNIVDQVNLEGCRSPDSIYITTNRNVRGTYDEGNISIDPDSIEISKISDDTIADNNAEPEIFKIVEKMPRFPGCEDQEISTEEKLECAKNKLLNFVYKNLKYPSMARENGIEGMSVVQFVVLRNGAIGDVTLVRDPGARLGISAQWVVNRMNYLCDRWSPGMQRGKPVKVLYTLPIKFALQ